MSKVNVQNVLSLLVAVVFFIAAVATTQEDDCCYFDDYSMEVKYSNNAIVVENLDTMNLTESILYLTTSTNFELFILESADIAPLGVDTFPVSLFKDANNAAYPNDVSPSQFLLENDNAYVRFEKEW